MRIHKEFIGGNIKVVSVNGDTVTLENELRDTIGDWFYWAFCVEGAAGKTVTFQMEPRRLGHFGPAVSHDLKHWHWLDQVEGDSFCYSFGPEEDKVYFAHSMLYHPERFLTFAKQKGLSVETLCQSKRGRDIPYTSFGEGNTRIVLAARNHACESTGSYVLEGVLERLIDHPIPDVTVFCVPFVDYDGVIDGDQGKGRAPHDHNRDYYWKEEPIYPEVAEIRKKAEEKQPLLAFDFHSPNHKGNEHEIVHDTVHMIYSDTKAPKYRAFSALLVNAMTPDAFQYTGETDYWNPINPSEPEKHFSGNMRILPENDIAFTLETAHFGTPENKASQEGLVALGRCFAEAIREYLAGGYI